MTKTVFISDLHVPYHDLLAWNKTIRFIKDFKPDTIINLGDFVDFYGISRFDKEPSRIDSLQNEINIAIELQAELRSSAPNARIYINQVIMKTGCGCIHGSTQNYQT